jgi:hypothetical protein
MSVTLDNVPGLNGGDNMPGTGTTIWGIPKADLQIVRTPGADGVTIQLAHVPKPGKGFYAFYNSLESGELKSSMKGGIDGRYQQQDYSGFIPGIRAVVLSILRKAQNVEMLWIAKLPNGTKIQLGDDIYPAYMSVETSTGKAGGDEVSGSKINIKSYGIATLLYDAEIPLRPSGAFTGSALLAVGEPGTTGDTLDLFVRSAEGGEVQIGTFTHGGSEDAAGVATALAASINSGTGTHGFTAVATDNEVAVTAPAGSDTTYDGFRLEADIDGAITLVSTLLEQTF